MLKQQSRTSNAVLFSIIGVATMWRVATHFIDHGNALLSLTPMYAVVLFAAAYFRDRVKPLIIPVAALFLSDIVLCFSVYAPFRVGLLYDGWYWVYGAFVIIAMACIRILKRLTVARLITSLFVSSFLHWLIATLSVCTEQPQPTDFLASYFKLLLPAGLYELKLLGGTVFYAVLIFGSYAFYQKRFSSIVNV